MKRSNISLILMLLLVFGLAVNAQTGKNGYTNGDLLLASMPEYEEVLKQLQSQRQTLEQNVQNKQVEINDKLTAYQQQRSLMTAEAKAQKEQELTQLQQQYEQMVVKYDQELKQKEVQLLNPLLEKVNNAINQVAKAKSLHAVWKSDALLYADQVNYIDITKDVATILGIQFPEGGQ